MLKSSDDRSGGPRSLSQEALERARGSTGHGFGNILSISAVGVLEQQAAQVLLAALSSFRTAKVGSEDLVKGGKVSGDAFKSCSVHLHPPKHGDGGIQILHQKSVVVVLDFGAKPSRWLERPDTPSGVC